MMHGRKNIKISKLVKGTILKSFVTKCMLLTFGAIKLKKKAIRTQQSSSIETS